jgi:uncharacterized protein YdeI (YjbR/CyaY-like superfamily)
MKMLSKVVEPTSRAQWRKWLARHHATEKEIWLLTDVEAPAVSYLDAVEEALCFGWIDSVGKRLSETMRGQRFSPRRPRGNWTELNKARVRRLISLGLMTDAGRAVLPDLDTAFTIAPDVWAALGKAAGARAFFEACPLLYRRIRVGYVEEQRKKAPAEFAKRLANLVARCAEKKQFGNWEDGGRLTEQHAGV